MQTRRFVSPRIASAAAVFVATCAVTLWASVIGAKQCSAGSYAEEMSKAVKKAFGGKISSLSRAQQSALVWYTYPTDNFGVGTTSIRPDKKDNASKAVFRCASTDCVGHPPGPAVTPLNLYDYASVGKGPSVHVDEKAQRNIAIGALLNGIAGMLGVDVGFAKAKTTTYTLSIGSATIRQLNKERYEQFLRDSVSTEDPRRKAFDEGRLVIFDADVVVDGLEFTISVDSRSHAGVVAHLDEVAAKGAAGDSILSIRLSSERSGKYRLKAAGALVVAVAPFEQRASSELLITPEYEWVKSRLPAWGTKRPQTSSDYVTRSTR
jgi:hypothetical protein